MKGLLPDELCEVCKNSKRQKCLTETQVKLNMKCIRQIVEENQTEQLTPNEKSALCLFLSQLEESEAWFALKSKILMSQFHKDVYEDIVSYFEGLEREQITESYQKTYGVFCRRYAANSLPEKAFKILHELAKWETISQLKSKYRQSAPTRTIVESMRCIPGLKPENKQLKRDGFLIQWWKNLYDYIQCIQSITDFSDKDELTEEKKIVLKVKTKLDDSKIEEIIKRMISQELCIDDIELEIK